MDTEIGNGSRLVGGRCEASLLSMTPEKRLLAGTSVEERSRGHLRRGVKAEDSRSMGKHFYWRRLI